MSVSHSVINRFLISATCKGGVGKSFFLVNLADWFTELDQKFTFFDSDFCNGTLTRFLPASRFLNLQHSSEVVREIHETLPESEVVAWDALGPLQQDLPEWLEQAFLQDPDGTSGFRITMILMIEEDKDTVFQAGELARRLGDRVDWLVVKNFKQSQFSRIYDQSQARQTLLASKAHEIALDKLPPHLNEILQARSWTIDQALDSGELNLLDRQRLIAYSRTWFQQLDEIKSILLP